MCFDGLDKGRHVLWAPTIASNAFCHYMHQDKLCLLQLRIHWNPPRENGSCKAN